MTARLMAASHAAVYRTAALAGALTLAGLGLLYAGHRLTNSTPKEGI